MKELKISIYKRSASDPDTTIRIPLSALEIVHTLIPKKVNEKIVDEGIDLQEILKEIKAKDTSGKLAEIQDKDERVVISVE
ncbi:MAG: hypothetical protein ACE5K0_07155 [Candidatus Methanofastidiosia archaeon]